MDACDLEDFIGGDIREMRVYDLRMTYIHAYHPSIAGICP